MSITPISNIEQISSQLNSIEGTKGSNDSASFFDVFKNAINDVNTTDQQAKQSEMLAAIGENDDLHTLMINTAKADLTLQTLVQIRNKALDAYNEIMKITL